MVGWGILNSFDTSDMGGELWLTILWMASSSFLLALNNSCTRVISVSYGAPGTSYWKKMNDLHSNISVLVYSHLILAFLISKIFSTAECLSNFHSCRLNGEQ